MSNYLKDFGYAPGEYHCQCVACKGNFFGDKRATVCKSCAENSAWKPQPDTPAPCYELGRSFTTLSGEYVTRQNAEEVIAAKDARIAELEAEREAAFRHIPMIYLKTHDVDGATGPTKALKLADALRDYSEARWHVLDRIKDLEADNERLREALECLTTFANSFHITVVDNFYQDVTLHLKTPHSLATRILSDSSKSFIFKDLEERRRIATALGEVKP